MPLLTHPQPMLKADLKSKLITKTTKRKTKKQQQQQQQLKAYNKARKKRRYITEDIILHTLLPFLPAKSLFRFKSVCRRWNSLVSGSADFGWDQCRSYTSPSGLFYMHDVKPRMRGLIPVSPASVGVPDPTLGFAGRRVTVLASSNGLLLCHRNGRSPHFVVCNPATREETTVKKPATYYPLRVGFGFDPSDSSMGFTIACVTFRQHHLVLGHPVFHVYSSRTGWRKPSGKAVVSRTRWHGSSLFAARQIHWHVHNTVLSFDPYTDISRVTPLPANGHELPGAKHYWRLGEMRGRLSCIDVVHGAELQVWLMDEVCWAKVYCVPLGKIFRKNLAILDESCGVGEQDEVTMGGDGEEKKKRSGKKVMRSRTRSLVRTCPVKPLPSVGDGMLFLWMRRRVFSYDLLTMRLTELFRSDTRAKFRFFPYVNNLAPLGEISSQHPVPLDIDSDISQDLLDE